MCDGGRKPGFLSPLDRKGFRFPAWWFLSPVPTRCTGAPSTRCTAWDTQNLSGLEHLLVYWTKELFLPPYREPGTFPVYRTGGTWNLSCLLDWGTLEPFLSTGLGNPSFHHTGNLSCPVDRLGNSSFHYTGNRNSPRDYVWFTRLICPIDTYA